MSTAFQSDRANPYHYPKGSGKGGQFAPAPGGGKAPFAVNKWPTSKPGGKSSKPGGKSEKWSIGLTGDPVDPKLQPKIDAALQELSSRYSVPLDSLHVAWLDSNVTLARTYRGSADITLNARQWGYAPDLAKDLAQSMVPTMQDIGYDYEKYEVIAARVPFHRYDKPEEDVILHEYAHVLMNRLREEDRAAYLDLVKKIQQESGTYDDPALVADKKVDYVEVKKAQIPKRIAFASRYGAYGVMDPNEGIAEVFVALEHGDTGPAAIALKDAIARYRTTTERFNAFHDPKSGKFTNKLGGVGIPSSAEIEALEAKARNGGFTYSTVSHKSPMEGFAFSPYPDRSRVVDTERLTPDTVRNYVKDNQDLLNQKGHFLGAWREQGPGVDRIWLDVSVVAETQQEATTLGKEYNQIAAWDLVGGKEIQLGGTGRSMAQEEKLTRYIVPIDGLDVEEFVKKVKGTKDEGRANPYHYPSGKKGGQFAPKPGGTPLNMGKGGGGGAWDVDVPNTIDPSIQPDVKSQLQKLSEKYSVPVALKPIDTKPGDTNYHTIAGNENYYGPHTPEAGVPAQKPGEPNTVLMNNRYWDDAGKLRDELKSRSQSRTKLGGEFPGVEPTDAKIEGPWVPGSDISDVINHEYGEVLFTELQRDDPKAADRLIGQIDELIGAPRMKGTSARMFDRAKLQAFVRQYGFFSAAIPKEAVGEGFASAQRGETTPLAALVTKSFERYLTTKRESASSLTPLVIFRNTERKGL